MLVLLAAACAVGYTERSVKLDFTFMHLFKKNQEGRIYSAALGYSHENFTHLPNKGFFSLYASVQSFLCLFYAMEALNCKMELVTVVWYRVRVNDCSLEKIKLKII